MAAGLDGLTKNQHKTKIPFKGWPFLPRVKLKRIANVEIWGSSGTFFALTFGDFLPGQPASQKHRPGGNVPFLANFLPFPVVLPRVSHINKKFEKMNSTH